MAFSMDIVIPSDPLSNEYRIVEGTEAHEPSMSCHNETIRDANIWTKIGIFGSVDK